MAETVADEAQGRVPLAFGGQSTSTLELVRLAKAAQSMGFDFLQVSCPLLFQPYGSGLRGVRQAVAAAGT